jgi:hypothetical protein
VSVRDRCTVCVERTTGSEIVWTHTLELQGDVCHFIISFRLEILTFLILDRFTVCAEHTIGLEIILDAPDGTSR